MKINRQHPFLNIDPRLDKITAILFKHTSFDYFDYEKYYHNGLLTGTHHNLDFSYEIFSNNFLPTLQELETINIHYAPLSSTLIKEKQYALVLENMASAVLKNIAVAERHHIFHRLCLIFKHLEYVEVFSFGITQAMTSYIEIFIRESRMLERFCIYFREAAQDIIRDIDQYKICFDNSETTVNFNSILRSEEEGYQNFLNDLKLTKYKIQGKQGTCYLSEREFECLLYSVENKTAKQISKFLSLSPRTVESYLENLKNKLGCASKAEFFDIAKRNPIIRAYAQQE